MLGLATELAFTLVVRGRPRTSLWMLPVYGLAQPLFEPAHELVRSRRLVTRALVYGVGFGCVEYVSGRTLRALHGSTPWDYSHARLHLGGLVRIDYLPLWAAYGLVLEHVHDRLVDRPPARVGQTGSR